MKFCAGNVHVMLFRCYKCCEKRCGENVALPTGVKYILVEFSTCCVWFGWNSVQIMPTKFDSVMASFVNPGAVKAVSYQRAKNSPTSLLSTFIVRSDRNSAYEVYTLCGWVFVSFGTRLTWMVVTSRPESFIPPYSFNCELCRFQSPFW